MKILVTGGAGYVGTKLAKALVGLDEVEEVVIYDNLSRANYNLFLGERFKNPGKIKFILGDLLDSRKLRQIINHFGIDTVYHLAARVTTPFANTDAHLYEQINHWGTSELVLAIEESPSVKKFFYTSSASVYGPSSEMVTEINEPNPTTFYGISKYRGENHVKRMFRKLNAYVLRCGNVYGYSKSMRFDAVINRFMFDANFNSRISIHGNGLQSRAFIHVDVLAYALAQMALRQIPSGIYNLVDKNLSIIQIADVLKQIFPELEFIFINQHLSLSEVQVNPDSELRNYIDYSNPKELIDELIEFKNRFSF
jgi:UDP-glucose 4-epimerase